MLDMIRVVIRLTLWVTNASMRVRTYILECEAVSWVSVESVVTDVEGEKVDSGDVDMETVACMQVIAPHLLLASVFRDT